MTSSPYINHFIQPDTIIPNPANSQSLNRYSYVQNNPIRFNDPTGHRLIEAGEGGGNSFYCSNNKWSDCGGNLGSETTVDKILKNKKDEKYDIVSDEPDKWDNELLIPLVSNYTVSLPSQISIDYWLSKITFFNNFSMTSNLPGAPITISSSDVTIGNGAYSNTAIKYNLPLGSVQIGNVNISSNIGASAYSFTSTSVTAKSNIKINGGAFNSTFSVGMEYEQRPNRKLAFAAALAGTAYAVLNPPAAPRIYEGICRLTLACK